MPVLNNLDCYMHPNEARKWRKKIVLIEPRLERNIIDMLPADLDENPLMIPLNAIYKELNNAIMRPPKMLSGEIVNELNLRIIDGTVHDYLRKTCKDNLTIVDQLPAIICALLALNSNKSKNVRKNYIRSFYYLANVSKDSGINTEILKANSNTLVRSDIMKDMIKENIDMLYSWISSRKSKALTFFSEISIFIDHDISNSMESLKYIALNPSSSKKDKSDAFDATSVLLSLYYSDAYEIKNRHSLKDMEKIISRIIISSSHNDIASTLISSLGAIVEKHTKSNNVVNLLIGIICNDNIEQIYREAAAQYIINTKEDISSILIDAFKNPHISEKSKELLVLALSNLCTPIKYDTFVNNTHAAVWVVKTLIIREIKAPLEDININSKDFFSIPNLISYIENPDLSELTKTYVKYIIINKYFLNNQHDNEYTKYRWERKDIPLLLDLFKTNICEELPNVYCQHVIKSAISNIIRKSDYLDHTIIHDIIRSNNSPEDTRIAMLLLEDLSYNNPKAFTPMLIDILCNHEKQPNLHKFAKETLIKLFPKIQDLLYEYLDITRETTVSNLAIMSIVHEATDNLFQFPNRITYLPIKNTKSYFLMEKQNKDSLDSNPETLDYALKQQICTIFEDFNRITSIQIRQTKKTIHHDLVLDQTIRYTYSENPNVRGTAISSLCHILRQKNIIDNNQSTVLFEKLEQITNRLFELSYDENPSIRELALSTLANLNISPNNYIKYVEKRIAILLQEGEPLPQNISEKFINKLLHYRIYSSNPDSIEIPILNYIIKILCNQKKDSSLYVSIVNTLVKLSKYTIDPLYVYLKDYKESVHLESPIIDVLNKVTLGLINTYMKNNDAAYITNTITDIIQLSNNENPNIALGAIASFDYILKNTVYIDLPKFLPQILNIFPKLIFHDDHNIANIANQVLSKLLPDVNVLLYSLNTLISLRKSNMLHITEEIISQAILAVIKNISETNYTREEKDKLIIVLNEIDNKRVLERLFSMAESTCSSTEKNSIIKLISRTNKIRIKTFNSTCHNSIINKQSLLTIRRVLSESVKREKVVLEKLSSKDINSNQVTADQTHLQQVATKKLTEFDTKREIINLSL